VLGPIFARHKQLPGMYWFCAPMAGSAGSAGSYQHPERANEQARFPSPEHTWLSQHIYR